MILDCISYQTWIKTAFFKKPRGLVYSQLLKAKDFFECERICTFYFQDYKTRRKAVLAWINEEKNYDSIISKNGYNLIVYYSPFNNAITYVYLGKIS